MGSFLITMKMTDTDMRSDSAPADGLQPSLLSRVGAAIAGECLSHLDADAGFVATVGEDGALDVARVTQFSEAPVRLVFPVDAPYPIAATMRTGQPLFIASNEALCEHPGLLRVKSEDHACATQPLFDEDGQVIGALNIGFDDPHEFSEEELRLLGFLAHECAVAMAAARRAQAAVREPSQA